MPQGRTGISATTPDRLMLDAGAAYFNIDLTLLEAAVPTVDNITDAIAAGTAVGATRDGSSFDVGRTLRDIPADGKLGRVKGMLRRQSVEPVLTLNMLEITVGNLLKAIAGATSSSVGSTFEKIVGGEITDSIYIDNVALITTMTEATGDPDSIVIVVKNAIVIDAPSLATADEDEAVLEVAFAATFDSSTPLEEPWAIYHPGAAPV